MTPTGKQRSYQTSLANEAAVIYVPALRITNNVFGSSGYEPHYNQELELIK